jgi:hypothetical protein
VEIVRLVGSIPNSSIFTGHMPVAAAGVLAALLLLWGVSGLPEVATARARIITAIQAWHWQKQAVFVVLVTLPVLGAPLLATRPDGYLHVNILASGQGEAFLVRGPNGATVLVPGSSPDQRGLASLVGDRLNAWETAVTAVLLDESNESSLAETLRRYPPATRLLATQDMRVDVGGGAAVEVYVDDAGTQGVAVSFGNAWVQLAGLPPAPAEPERLVAIAGGRPRPVGSSPPFLTVGAEDSVQDAEYVLAPPREGALELVSDGLTIWPANGIGADGGTNLR